MDKNVIAVGLFLILVFAMTATAHYVFVAHEPGVPPVHDAGHGDESHDSAPGGH